jgi:transcriptional regulator with XRE-family HTH domain
LRNKAGLSQEELGAKIGVKKAAIHKYETGLVVNLKRSILAKLAEALDSTPAYLLGLDDKNPQPDAMARELRRLGAVRADGSLDLDRLNAIISIIKASEAINAGKDSRQIILRDGGEGL